LQKLEDSGLTREEILFNDPVGLSLSDDPFFQLLKTSRIAREMLMNANESFTVEKIIDKALR